MITFKQKHYVVPSEQRFIKPEPFLFKKEWNGLRFDFEVIETGSYLREVNSRSKDIWKIWKKDLKRVRKVRKEISDYQIYDDDPKSRIPTDTHYYPDESEVGKRYYTSKSINGTDRLMYDIYAPELIEDPNTGEKIIRQKVNLLYCIGHTHRNGKKFSKTQ